MLKNIILVFIALALLFGLILLEAWLGMFLFNWVAGLFGFAFALTFEQAVGACLLLHFIGSFFGKSSDK